MVWFKKSILLVVCCTCMAANPFAQSDREIVFTGNTTVEMPKGYLNHRFLRFDTLEKINTADMPEFAGMEYEFYVTFKIDTSGNVIDFSLLELPVCPVPPLIKSAISHVINATSGKWWPKLKEGKKVISDETIWRVSVIKKGWNPEEGIKAAEKLLAYHESLLRGAVNDSVIEQYDQSKKWRSIICTY